VEGRAGTNRFWRQSGLSHQLCVAALLPLSTARRQRKAYAADAAMLAPSMMN
jgi:hypothetical protein